jgi:hypothetical protein
VTVPNLNDFYLLARRISVFSVSKRKLKPQQPQRYAENRREDHYLLTEHEVVGYDSGNFDRLIAELRR